MAAVCFAARVCVCVRERDKKRKTVAFWLGEPVVWEIEKNKNKKTEKLYKNIII